MRLQFKVHQLLQVNISYVVYELHTIFTSYIIRNEQYIRIVYIQNEYYIIRFEYLDTFITRNEQYIQCEYCTKRTEYSLRIFYETNSIFESYIVKTNTIYDSIILTPLLYEMNRIVTLNIIRNEQIIRSEYMQHE